MRDGEKAAGDDVYTEPHGTVSLEICKCLFLVALCGVPVFSSLALFYASLYAPATGRGDGRVYSL
ncbi:MAG: hypothetical protein R3231_01130 [bacterium]|nr:hypothetical protein [bacterium]